MLLAGLFSATAGAVQYFSIRSALAHLNRAYDSRGREIGAALAAMAGESYSSKKRPALSELLHRVKEVGSDQSGEFEILNIALVDAATGRIYAHNDPAMTARDAKHPFGEKRYASISNLPRRSPVHVEVLKSLPLEIPYLKFIGNYREYVLQAFPELKRSGMQYHIGAAVYVRENQYASARLHIIVQANGQKLYLNSLSDEMLKSLIALGIGFLLASLLISLLFFLTAPRTAAWMRRSNSASDGREESRSESDSDSESKLKSKSKSKSKSEVETEIDDKALDEGRAEARAEGTETGAQEFTVPFGPEDRRKGDRRALERRTGDRRVGGRRQSSVGDFSELEVVLEEENAPIKLPPRPAPAMIGGSVSRSVAREPRTSGPRAVVLDAIPLDEESEEEY